MPRGIINTRSVIDPRTRGADGGWRLWPRGGGGGKNQFNKFITNLVFCPFTERKKKKVIENGAFSNYNNNRLAKTPRLSLFNKDFATVALWYRVSCKDT